MKKDPVCGMQVNENQAAASSMYKGERYLFCSQQCKDKFDKNPEQYTRQHEYAHEGTGQKK